MRALTIFGLLGCALEAPTWSVELVDGSDADLFARASSLELVVYELDKSNPIASDTVDPTRGSLSLPKLPLGEYRLEARLLDPEGNRLGYGGSSWQDLAADGLETTVVLGESPGFIRPDVELPEGLAGVTVTPLHDGTLFVAGGATLNGDCQIEAISNKTYIYDVNAASLSAGPTMESARAFHSATLLKPDPVDGRQRVLLVGGLSVVSGKIQSIVTAEVYDPEVKTFRSTGALGTARHGHATALLVSADVLIVGGAETQAVTMPATLEEVAQGQTILSSGEVFTPDGNTGSFGSIQNELSQGRLWATAHRGSGNDIAILGGMTVNEAGVALATQLVELYKQDDNRFQPDSGEGQLREARFAHVSARLADSGDIFIAGGIGEDGEALSSAEIYADGKGAEATGSLVATRAFAALSQLGQREFVVTGGQDSGSEALNSAETWAKSSTLVEARMSDTRMWHAQAALPSSIVAIFGGVTQDCRPALAIDLFVPP